MSFYVLHPAMKKRPYIVNEKPLPVGYWQDFFSSSSHDSWIALPYRVECRSAPLGDALGWIGGMSLFSKAATDLMSDATGGNLKFAFFGNVKNKPYWIMSTVPTVADLRAETIANAGPIFCLPGQQLVEIFADEIIPKMIVAEKLKGFQFRTPHQPHLKALFKGEDVNAYPGVLA